MGPEGGQEQYTLWMAPRLRFATPHLHPYTLARQARSHWAAFPKVPFLKPWGTPGPKAQTTPETD